MLSDEELEQELLMVLEQKDSLTYFCLTLEKLRRERPNVTVNFAWGYRPSWNGRYVERLNQDPFLETVKPFAVLTPLLAEILTQELPGYGKNLLELDGVLMVSPEGVLQHAFMNYRLDTSHLALQKKLVGEHLAEKLKFRHNVLDVGLGTIKAKAVSHLLPLEGLTCRLKASGAWYLFSQGQTVLCSYPDEEEALPSGPWTKSILKLREFFHEAVPSYEVRLKREFRVKEPLFTTQP